jgi:hypothetical protein
MFAGKKYFLRRFCSHIVIYFKKLHRHLSIGDDKTVAISDWRGERVIASVKGEAAVTYHLASVLTCPTNFLSVGDKHIRLWDLNG